MLNELSGGIPLCPRCKKRPKRVFASGKLDSYCRECHRAAAAQSARRKRRERRRAKQSDLFDGCAPAEIPAEVGTAIERRGWDADAVVSLTKALLLMEAHDEVRPGKKTVHVISYHGQEIRWR